MANSPSGDSLIARVVRILEAFDRERPELSQSALARRADLPLSTAQRLTTELIRQGLLERTGAGGLRPGLRLWELASRGSRTVSLREAALPFMGDVLQTLQQHTTLGVLDAGSVLYVERLSAPQSPLDYANIAQRMPVNASSAGIVLMAHQPPEVQGTFLSGTMVRRTRHTPIDPVVLRRLFAEARTRGFVVAAGIGVETWTGVSVPVWGPGGVVAALSAMMPRDDADVTRVVPALVTAAHGIGRMLRGEAAAGSAATR